MSDEQELKLACLHHAGGNLDHAKSLFDWVSGSVRATPQSEAPAVSAPNQDKPEQPFNYQHPSKYGTDVPRRCYLEELTPEERAIRDLVGAIEHLGAHPLLTTTVIQLMKAGESLADWVDIGLRDKAIAALSTDLVRTEVVTDGDREDPITSEPETHTGNGGEEFLLDEGQRAPDESSSQASSTDAPAWQRFRASEGWHTFEGVRDYEYFTFLEGVKFEMAIVGGGRVIVTSPGPGVKLDEPVRNVEAYRIIDAKADEVGETTSELDSSSEPQAATEQEQKDESTPVLDALPPSIPRSEIPEGAAVETFTDAGVETVKIGGITRIVEDVADQGQGDASVFAHGILEETKAEPERPSLIDRILGRAVPA